MQRSNEGQERRARGGIRIREDARAGIDDTETAATGRNKGFVVVWEMLQQTAGRRECRTEEKRDGKGAREQGERARGKTGTDKTADDMDVSGFLVKVHSGPGLVGVSRATALRNAIGTAGALLQAG